MEQVLNKRLDLRSDLRSEQGVPRERLAPRMTYDVRGPEGCHLELEESYHRLLSLLKVAVLGSRALAKYNKQLLRLIYFDS